MMESVNGRIIELLGWEGVEIAAPVPFAAARVINPRFIERDWPDAPPETAIMFAVPYYSDDRAGRNISLYAVPRDYHIFFARLFEKILSKLAAEAVEDQNPYPRVKGYGDVSPIDEVHAAALAGLGVIGSNGLFINEKYGSYVFIGEFLTGETTAAAPREPRGCLHCGKCRAACPSPERCLSQVTQTKGELSETDVAKMLAVGTVWGCDICQIVCPMNRGVSKTGINFFKRNLIYTLDENFTLEDRAYAWRGKRVIERNIKIMNNKNGDTK